MTLKELKRRVDFAMQNEQNHVSIVCIPNNLGGMGGTSVTNVTGTGVGFDWDSGKFMIFTEVKMTEKKDGKIT